MVLARRQLRIADSIVTLESDGLPWDFAPEGPHRRFEVTEQAAGLRVAVHWEPYAADDLGDEILALFNTPARSSPVARLYRSERGSWGIEANGPEYDVYRRRVGVFEPDLTHGDLYLDLRHRDLDVYPSPIGPPLDRLLFVHLLALRSGLLLHAGGIICDGRAYVFTGSSGAGKTTMARLWAQMDDVTVLGEECIAVRRHDSGFWAYGTPWIGESRSYSSSAAPLAGVFLIHHAPQNRLATVPLEWAVEELLARSFLTAYDQPLAERGLDLVLDLVSSIAVHEFGFVPNESAAHLIRAMM